MEGQRADILYNQNRDFMRDSSAPSVMRVLPSGWTVVRAASWDTRFLIDLSHCAEKIGREKLTEVHLEGLFCGMLFLDSYDS